MYMGCKLSQAYTSHIADKDDSSGLLAEDGEYGSSTLFVDVLGPLTNGTNFSTTAARSAVSTQAQQVTDTVKAGYMVRASADWNVRTPFLLLHSDYK